MSKLLTLAVYCGASGDAAASYLAAAYRLGRELAGAGIAVVFGGGREGLMGRLADGVTDTGGTLIGVLPRHLNDREIAHARLTTLHLVETMHERKQRMADLSDAFVVLPGGFGTLDELFEIVTWRQLGLHDKPIVVVDLDGYWSHLRALIQRIRQEGFAAQRDRELIHWISGIGEVIQSVAALLDKPDRLGRGA